ncbi:Retrovirus-related Pol polyprotein, partial [Mucuna pruriens]
MCDASNSALGAVLGQRAGVDKLVHVIVYASRTMDPAQSNYTTTEKELLAIIFALDKFRSYLLDSKIIVFSDLAALRFLLKKPDAKPRLIRWMILIQEFNIEIRDKKGAENSIADHLSRIERGANLMPIRDEFSDEQLLHITMPTPWFAHIYNFVAAYQFPPEASHLYKERLQNDAKYYIWDDPYLWRLYNDQVIRRCIPDTEINSVLQFVMQHLEAATMGQLGLPEKCLIAGSIGPPFSGMPINSSPLAKNAKKLEWPLTKGMRCPSNPYCFAKSLMFGGHSQSPMDYVSRWVEAIATKTNDAKVVVDFLKSNIFYRFGVSKVLISDQGSHFYSRAMSSLLHKYGVVHRIATAYHPRPMAKLKTSADSLRTFFGHIELHTELRWGCLPTELSLNTELTRQLNSAIWTMTKQGSRDNSSCKNWTNFAWKPMRTLESINLEERVLSQAESIVVQFTKLRSKWDGPFVITNVFPYGTVELKDEHTNSTFQVNGHHIKLYHEGPVPIASDMETISLMEPTPPDDTP